MKTIIKTIIKKSFVFILDPMKTFGAINNYNGFLKMLVTYRFFPTYRKSVKQLQIYKNKHAGKRCFIIGNGPSLKKMDLSFLKNEYTFGLNRIYLLFDSMGFTTTYFVSVNNYVIKQFAKDITKLSCPKFISWHAQSFIPFASNTMFLYSRNGPRFCKDIIKEGIWEGATVTYVAMQLAYYMGFKQVILLGVDHSFQTKGQPHKLVVSKDNDQNHFHPDYFGKGIQWQLPDLLTSEVAYKLAKHQFELDGREILDATVGGKLQVFPKIKYTDIVNKE